MGKSQKTTLYLVRHCDYSSPHDLVARYLPRIGLSPAGKIQAQKLSQYFKSLSIHAIYTSPLLRTRQTARIIDQALGFKYQASKLLLEVASPVAKITHRQLAKFGAIYNHPLHQKNGETQQAVLKRMQRFVNLILTRHPGKNIIAVSHGDPIMLATYGSFNHPYIPKGGIIKLTFLGQNLDSCEQIII